MSGLEVCPEVEGFFSLVERSQLIRENVVCGFLIERSLTVVQIAISE